MKKIIFAFCAFFAMTFVANAQQDGFGRSVRVSYGHLWGEMAKERAVLGDKWVKNYGGVSQVFFVEASALRVNSFSFGCYIGLSKGSYGTNGGYQPGPSIPAGDTVWYFHSDPNSTLAFRYGISMSAHLLPLVSVESKHWDVELKGSLGSYSQSYMNPQAEYSLGVGVSFYFSRHWGLFAESQWGKYVFTDDQEGQDYPMVANGNAMFKCGLSYRY